MWFKGRKEERRLGGDSGKKNVSAHHWHAPTCRIFGSEIKIQSNRLFWWPHSTMFSGIVGSFFFSKNMGIVGNPYLKQCLVSEKGWTDTVERLGMHGTARGETFF